MKLEQNEVLQPSMERDSRGNKALLFSYKLYLLPNGDLETAVSNVDPEKLKTILLDGLKEQAVEYAHQSASAIRYLVENAKMADEELGRVLGSL